MSCPAGEPANIICHAAKCEVDGKPDRRNRQYGRNQKALVHRAHDILSAAKTDEIGTDNRCDDANAANQQWQAHEVHEQPSVCHALHQQSDQHHRCTNGHNIGFEQVSGHTCAIADIVTNVICDNGGVAWIVFGNTCLNLAD
jgi:hypothetical protein